ncbi:SDR family oxidoreductase [Salinimicrobium xinjiangense]|uniref:SDR family oxidoreductase n=1 Tax=Salinimicrobium xinjiangense TaxID=438596 RepID=UPI00040FDB9C|nr:SDR family oxidoreductase [Salinimicrobium xinjiangense]
MSKPKDLPKQEQEKQPGKQQKMHPEPEVIRKDYKGSDKLKGKVALITGGDSGIGQSVAVHFAKEGAKVAIVYLSEDKDAKETVKMTEKAGSEGLAIKGDLKDEKFCREVVQKTVDKFGGLNILVNNAAMQFPKEEPEEVTSEQVRTTFETNIYPYFFTVNEALKHLSEGDSIINTTSVTAYRGSEHLLDYSSTKGAITAYTRSLSKMLAEKNIRVNGVAPGPIWTPLIPASFDAEHVAEFGKKVPLGRAGQPSEVGPAYVFLASKDGSYITGQVIHVNGGEVVGA